MTPISKGILRENFGAVWRVHTRGFTRLLIECRKHFDGDLDQVLILSSIGERAFTMARAHGLTYDQFQKGQRKAGEPGRINTQSIADSTGIPRETVRRKIALLCEKGWVERTVDRSFVVTEKAVAVLAPVREVTFDYLLDIGNVMVKCVGGPKDGS
jgi:hypothetical protein